MIKKLLLLALLLPWLCSCNNDDYVYPNVITEMIDLQTNETGVATYLVTDDGIRWHLQPHKGLDGLVPDTTYRTVSMYSPLSHVDEIVQEAILYNTRLVIADLPKPEATVDGIKLDPVILQSIWRSGRYLNLIIQVKMKDQKHSYGFIEHQLAKKADGTQELNLTLYHDRNNDVEGFNSTVYLSVPLWVYEDVLRKGDKIVFHLNTYKEGIISRTFEY